MFYSAIHQAAGPHGYWLAVHWLWMGEQSLESVPVSDTQSRGFVNNSSVSFLEKQNFTWYFLLNSVSGIHGICHLVMLLLSHKIRCWDIQSLSPRDW